MMSRCFLAIVLCAEVLCGYAQPIPFEQYQIPSSQCFHFETITGSHIFIEEGALLSERDSLQLTYRELVNPADMILHDVQMHATWGSDRFQLVSSGMFEIYVLDEGDTLTVQPGKRLLVQMGADEVAPLETAAYKYDETNDDWRSYRSPVSTQALQDDSDLWGSGPVQQEAVMEVWDEGGFGWAESFGVVDSVRREIFQSMEITEFGLFNYDQVLDGVEYQYLQAAFVDEGGKALKSTVYVVYEDINSVFYFPPYNWESQFFLIKDRPYKLFTITEEGDVSALEDYPELLPATTSHRFELIDQVQRQDTRTSLNEILASP